MIVPRFAPATPARWLLGRVRRRVHDWWRGETAATLFDLRDRRALNALLTDHGVPPLTADPAQADAGVGGAMRYVVARRATADPSGIAGELSAAGRANLTLAMAGPLGERVKRLFDLRVDVRTEYPLARTPHPDRAAYLRWLLVYAMPEYHVTPEEILWAAAEDDETPDRGLVVTYLLAPAWQAAVPDALATAGWPTLKAYLAHEYGLGSRWFRRARLTKPVEPVAPAAGVNIAAHFRYPSGLQEAAFGVDHALARAGRPTSRRDLPVLLECDWRDRADYHGTEVYDTTIYIAAVNTFPDLWVKRAGLHWRPGVRRIAVWYWELEEVPAEWVPRLGWPDEVWAPTAFVAAAFRKVVPVPVRPMLPGVGLPAVERRPRAYFGLPDGVLFLVTFDMGSVMARKNPLAALDAFRQAFPGGRPGVHLAVKVSRGDARPAHLAALTAAIQATPNATLIDRVLTREDTVALLAAADCYVSLHRSEGLGLGMAESMLLGKPVIATNYSGNLDFMTADTAYLVGYDRVAVGDDNPPYPPASHWADPHVGEAADYMRRVIDAPDEARALGARAQAHAAALLSLDAYAERVAAALSGGAASRTG